MTDLEYDLTLAIEWENIYSSELNGTEVNCAETANNLSKLGYQKIIWHDAKRDLPEFNKNVSAYSEYVLGYNAEEETFTVVSWDGSDWSDDNAIYYNVDYWAELPKFNK